MRVQRVLMPGTGFESWTVLGEDHMPVEPIERFLSYLASIEKSPNTIKAYAHDLKDWLTYLDRHGVDWRAARLEDVAGFVAWLRMPPQARDGQVAVLPAVEPYCSAAQREPEIVGGDVVLRVPCPSRCRVVGAADHHAAGDRARPARGDLVSAVPASCVQTRWRAAAAIKLKAPKTLPKVLTVQQVQTILDACEHLRDRLLFALMLDTGVRVGEALGLRHEDIAIAEKTITVTPRENANRARAKTGHADDPGQHGTDAPVCRLPDPGVRVPGFGLRVRQSVVGAAGPAVVVFGGLRPGERLRTRTGIAFGPHLYRHTYATWLLRRGAGMESVKELLGHASITTTIDTYGHLTVEDARQTLEAAGWFTGREVRW